MTTAVEEATTIYIQNLLNIIKDQNEIIDEWKKKFLSLTTELHNQKEKSEKRADKKHTLFVSAAVNDDGYLFFQGAYTSFEKAISDLTDLLFLDSSEESKLVSEISSLNGYLCPYNGNVYKLFSFETSLSEMREGTELDSESTLRFNALERAYYEAKMVKEDLSKKIEKREREVREDVDVEISDSEKSQ